MRLVALFLAAFVTAQPALAADLSAREILDRVDDLYRGKSARGQMMMKVSTAHFAREMTLEFYALGKDRSLARILSPLKEKGTATLKSGTNIWNYLPKTRRTIKVPSSMMGGSWMGSHFTNDDLVKESRMAEDFDFKMLPGGPADSLEIECTPKPNAAVVWGKILVNVRRSDSMPIEIRYFDEDRVLARTLTFSDIAKMDDREIPCRMRMVPADKPGEFTEVRYLEIDFDAPLDEDFFSLRALER